MSATPFEDDHNPFQTDDVSNMGYDVTSTPSGTDLSFPGSSDDEQDYSGGLNDESVATLHQSQRSPTSPPQPQLNSYPVSQNPNGSKEEFCCARDQFLHSGDEVEILITDALKTTENSTSPYIAYVIRTGAMEARRRYSEFESLRNALVKLYPTLIVPPIPSKQTIGDYAVKQAKAKEDSAMISRRKRMLQLFLNRVAKHPILSNQHVFHRFLDREVSWSEVLLSPPLSLLPKNILKAPSHDPTEANASSAYAALPTPPAAQPLRQPDQRFLDSEAFTNKFAAHLNGNMDKVTRRTMKRWSDYSQDHADLGALLNGFSLTESGNLATAIEKTGQVVDTTYMSTSILLQNWEQAWTEPLQEYGQFASIIKKLLVYRHQKHVQYEMTQDGLEGKREALEEYERSEAEARRLEQALNRGRSATMPSDAQDGAEQGDAEGEDGLGHSSFASGSRMHQSAPSLPSPRSRKGSYGLLSALSYSIHGLMDVDPEAARRNSISKTRDSISQLEDALHASAQDLKYASSTIQADLDRFQRQKVADIREMLIETARIHRDWCKANMEAWIEAKKEIDKIESHPNKPSPEVLAAIQEPEDTQNPMDTPTPNGVQ